MKELFALFLAVTMALTLVACGKKSEDAAKDRIGTAEAGMEFYVAIAEDGSKTVVDKSGAAAEGFTLDASGNIVDKDGQIIVAADKVQQLPAGETKPNESSEPSSGTSDSSSVPSGTGSEAKSNTGSAGSGSSDNKAPSGTGGSGSSGNSGSSSSGGSNSGSTPTAPDPKSAHQHSWEPVYRTVEDYEMREISYCVTCGQDMTGWSNTQLIEHSDYHLDRGESDQWRSEGRQVKVGEHQEIDHYICSCGSTKAP